MRKEIKGFSKYCVEDNKIIHKRTGHVIKVDKNGCVQLIKDEGNINTTVGVRKIMRLIDENYKTYKEIEEERNVNYKPVYGNSNYLFCEEVEDELKVWSVKNEYFLSPYYVKEHLRFGLSRKTVFYYKIVWQYYNQRKLKKGLAIHHVDGYPSHNNITNLLPVTASKHRQIHAKKSSGILTT